ncbi:MAG: AbrB/MazE/SpoVT family DNA-binding domain-containing protein [Thaumarchaeota archaeon]|nr:AbrB/MazE/SpoVT family DNA-binding domain-containing protein [Nitrososphaerota archaeon]
MAASSGLTFKKVKVTDKGQISIPVDIQRKIGITRGDELLLIAKGKRIVLEKPARVAELLENELAELQAISEESLRSLWLNKMDDVWDQYLSEAKT